MSLATITSLPQFSRNTRRFKEIAGVLVKYGLANWITEQFPDVVKDLFKTSDGIDLTTLNGGVRLRLALAELGPTFIKLGQVLSTRIDLVGPKLASELAELQSGTPPDPPDVVRATLESELGDNPDTLFAEFNYHAMASASIGQAHLAKFFDGQEVIVKVQHKGIEEKVTTDLDILIGLTKLAEQYDPELRYYQPQATAAEFRKSLLQELDFRREMRNMQTFRKNFTNNPAIHIPTAYPDFSTRRVLTMEKLEGYSISHLERLRQDGIDGKALIHTGANMFIDMVFRDRFYHADPHPGNIWALPGGVVGLLDCGMVGRLDSRAQEGIEEVLMAIIAEDAELLTDVVIRLGSAPHTLDRNALQKDVEEFVEEYVDLSVRDFDISNVLDALTEIIRTHHILLPTGISSLVRLLIMLEGTVRMLDPDFQLFELLETRKFEFTQKQFSPQRLLQRIVRSYRDWERLLTMLPRELADILEGLRIGNFDVHLDVRRLDTIVNRLVYGILSAALFMGSCQVLSAKIPPLLHGVSIFGAVGCVLATILGIRLLLAIRVSGDLGKKDQ